MTIWDLLPQNPMLGPPLPRFLNIYWPWYKGEEGALGITKYVTGVEEIITRQPAMTTYNNEEVWDIDWSPDGLPRKVTIHRQAKRS